MYCKKNNAIRGATVTHVKELANKFARNNAKRRGRISAFAYISFVAFVVVDRDAISSTHIKSTGFRSVWKWNKMAFEERQHKMVPNRFIEIYKNQKTKEILLRE